MTTKLTSRPTPHPIEIREAALMLYSEIRALTVVAEHLMNAATGPWALDIDGAATKIPQIAHSLEALGMRLRKLYNKHAA